MSTESTTQEKSAFEPPSFRSIGVALKNISDNPQKATLFSLTNKLESTKNIQVTFHGDYELLMQISALRTYAMSLLRLRSTNIYQWMEPITCIKRDVNRTWGIGIMPLLYLSIMQQQQTVIDIPLKMIINGLQELEFTVLPHTELAVNLYADHIGHGGFLPELLAEYDIISANQRLKCDEIPFAIRNTTDERKEVALFSNAGLPEGITVRCAWNDDYALQCQVMIDSGYSFNSIKCFGQSKQLDNTISVYRNQHPILTALPRLYKTKYQQQGAVVDFLFSKHSQKIDNKTEVIVSLEPHTTAQYIFYTREKDCQKPLHYPSYKVATSDLSKAVCFQPGMPPRKLNPERYNQMRLYLHKDFDFSLPIQIAGENIYPIFHKDIHAGMQSFVDITIPEVTLDTQNNFEYTCKQPLAFDLFYDEAQQYQQQEQHVVLLCNSHDEKKAMYIPVPKSGKCTLYIASDNASQITLPITAYLQSKQILIEPHISAYQMTIDLVYVPLNIEDELISLEVDVLPKTKVVYAFTGALRQENGIYALVA